MTERVKRLFTTENLIIAAVIFAAIFFAKFPTLYNWLNTPKGYWYPKNTSWFDAWDTNVQVSYIRYGQRKGIMLENSYTTTLHKPVFIYQYYTGLGIINRFLKLDPFVLFHIASIITSVVLLIVCYLTTRVFIKDTLHRISAFIIIVLGGGFAWMPYLSFSADNKIAGFTLVNALERGHDATSTLFLIFTFLSTYLYSKTSRPKYIIWGTTTGILGMTFHPPLFGLYFTLGVITAFVYWLEYKKFTFFKFPAILFLAFIIYGLIVLVNFLNNPAFSGMVTQNLFNADSLSLFLGFGFLSPFIFWSLINREEKSKELFFLKVFFLLQLFFLFLPSGFHLYFTKGLFVWGVLLGIYGITSLINNPKIQRIVLTFVVVTSLMTRVDVFTSLVDAKLNNPFFFLTKEEGETLSFISTLPADSGVLSLYRIGNYIPAHSDTRVYYGHKYQTPNGSQTFRRAQNFYTIMTEEEQRMFLKENNVNYIYYGLEEAQLRNDNKLKPQNPFPYFPVLYSNDAAIVYGIDKSVSK